MTARRDPSRRLRSPRRFRGGFTLVEIVVVVAVLAILAGFVVPRLGGVKRNEARLAAEEIEDLLRMFGYRHSIMTQQIGIWRRPDDGMIALMIRDLDPQRDDGTRIWQEDKLTMPIRLPPEVEIVEVRSDAEWLDPRSFFVQTFADGRRPRVEIRLSAPSGETSIGLEAHAVSPFRIGAGEDIGSVTRQPIDLDAEGRERVPW